MNALGKKESDPSSAACRFVPEKPTLKTKINELGMRAAGRLGWGLSQLLGGRAGAALGITTYHRIAPHIPYLPPPLHNVTPQRFRQQLTVLLARGFSVWPLKKVLKHHSHRREIPPRTLVVTFDDGFETVYLNAFPVLREFEIPATIFLNTAYLDTNTPFPFDAWGLAFQQRAPMETWHPLTTAQCREMLASGLVELGAHTHTHQDFRKRPDEFRRDLQTNVEFLRSRFDLEEVAFAFPYGSPALGFSGGELAAAAKETGVCCALTTEAVLVPAGSDPFNWGRFNAFPWDTGMTLAAKLEGWYSWAPQLRQWLGRALQRGGRRAAAQGQVTSRLDPE